MHQPVKLAVFFFVFTPSTSSAWPTAGSYYNIVDSHAEVRPSHASESGSSGFCIVALKLTANLAQKIEGR